MAWNHFVPGVANHIRSPISTLPGIEPCSIQFNPNVMPPASYTPAQLTNMNPDQQFSVQQNWQQWQN